MKNGDKRKNINTKKIIKYGVSRIFNFLVFPESYNTSTSILYDVKMCCKYHYFFPSD